MRRDAYRCPECGGNKRVARVIDGVRKRFCVNHAPPSAKERAFKGTGRGRQKRPCPWCGGRDFVRLYQGTVKGKARFERKCRPCRLTALENRDNHITSDDADEALEVQVALDRARGRKS